MARSPRTISHKLRREILDDEQCHYCGALWASEVEHVRPIIQGGSSTRENLVPACHRCNAEKWGRTPAEWKQARLAAGKSWPPPNCELVMLGIFTAAAESGEPFEDDFELVRRGVMARDSRVVEVMFGIHDHYYDENPAPPQEDWAALRDAARAFAAERDV